MGLRHHLAICAAGIVVGSVALPVCAQNVAKSAARDGWSMDQVTQLMGNVSVYMSAKGVKVINHKKGLNLICVAPYNEVTLYSENTKQYFTGPFSLFRCPVTKTLSVINCGLLADVPLRQKKDSVYKSLKVHTFESAPSYDQSQQQKYLARELPGRSIHSVKASTTDDFQQDPHVGAVLALFMGIPKIPGVPVFVDMLDLSGDNNHYLSSDKITRTKIADSIFAVPAGFKKVKRHEELFLNADTRDEVDMMMLGGH